MSRRLVVEADGGSRGNPGPAGYGALVRDAGTGELVAEVAEAIGTATNNVAEYRGLIAGLAAAAEIDTGASIEVRMDSKLVVEQMSGRWRVKQDHLRPLASEAAALIQGFPAVAFSWIPRERNTDADALANAAMDAAARGESWVRQERLPEVPEPEPGPPNRLSGWMQPPEPPTTFLVLRHGQTEHNVHRRFSGRNDHDLTDFGRRQVAAAADRLRTSGVALAAVISSPLLRARQTADLVAEALDLPVRVEDGFRETDFGEWEGLTFAAVEERWPSELAAWLADATVAPPGGESFADTALRVRRSRDAVLAAHPGQAVVVVSHVTPIKQLVRLAVAAPPVALFRLHVDSASLTELDWFPDGAAVLRRFNDTAHLSALVPGGVLTG